MSLGEIKQPSEKTFAKKVESAQRKEEPTSSDTKLLLLKVELLKKFDLFSCLPESALTIIAQESSDLVLEMDDLLFQEGSIEKKMYIILSGQILVYRGHGMIKRITVLEQGDYVGEMAMLDGLPRSASTKALCDTVLLSINEKVFNEIIASNSQQLLAMMRIFSTRVRNDLQTMEHDMKRISNFTHDMRNCLVPLGIAESHLTEISANLHGTLVEHKKRKDFEKLNKSYDTMMAVKNNMITMIDQSLACIKKTKQNYIRVELEIVPLVNETVEELACHKVMKDKNVKVVLDGPVSKALFNYLDIKRVLQNLLINAGYVSEKGSNIEVHVKDLEDRIQVSVKDYGTGIPEEIKPILLHESYTSKPEGSGFGLMSCKEIIEDFHKGSICFESEEGKGTTFYFTIGHNN